MPRDLTRIFSDVHYGDRASRVRTLAQLRPLLEGVHHLVLNGDTMDTRPGSAPAHTARCRAEVLAFFPAQIPQTTFLSGNHDPDLTPHHSLDLAGGKLFVTHGDIVFADIVPWGQDAPVIGARIAAELAALPAHERGRLAARLEVWRRVAAAIPQRHQSESRGLRYLARYARDTVWPPTRVWRILRTWRDEAACVAAFVQAHRPPARFAIVGHTHRPAVATTAAGMHVINTGSFCRPLGGSVVDLTADRLSVRRVELRRGEFHPADTVAEFTL